MNTLTIPKKLSRGGDLVVVPRKLFERLVAGRAKEAEILRLSLEARQLKREGRLPVLHSLKVLR